MFFIKYVDVFKFIVGDIHHICLIKFFAEDDSKKKKEDNAWFCLFMHFIILQKEYLCKSVVAIIRFSR